MTKKNFTEAKKELWDEIRQLVLNEGPLYDEMSRMLDGHEEEEIAEGTRESLVAHMIAARCAVIAAMDEKGEFFREPISMILGQWAGYALNQEIEATLKDEVRSILNIRPNFN